MVKSYTKTRLFIQGCDKPVTRLSTGNIVMTTTTLYPCSKFESHNEYRCFYLNTCKTPQHREVG